MPEIRDERKLPYQIQSELDDFGLDPYQFRVYCRVVRRANKGCCYESVSKIAEGCKMSSGKAKESLKWLIDHGFITRESRQGQSSLYRLNDISHWQQPSHDTTQVPGTSHGQVASNPGRYMARGGHDTTQVPGHHMATKDINKGFKEGIEESLLPSHPQPQVISADESHPVAQTEKRFQDAGKSDLPWVLSMANRYNPEYDAEMLEATMGHLKTTPSFERAAPTIADAKKWLAGCNSPSSLGYEKRMTTAYIVWELAQKLKQRNSDQRQHQEILHQPLKIEQADCIPEGNRSYWERVLSVPVYKNQVNPA